MEYYQNNDGGFRNAIEPDNWNPESTPYSIDFALGMLRKIDFIDIERPLYQNILRYLKDTPYRGANGWSFSIPANDNFPQLDKTPSQHDS